MSKKVIDVLNAARGRELLAISQYMVQHYELEDADFGKLAGTMKQIAIDEMKHAESLAERILFLNGTPTTKAAGEAKKGLKFEEMLKADIKLEEDAVKEYNMSAKICAEESDNISKDLFESLLGVEEGHLDEFQNILDHIEKLGPAYIATLTG